MLKQISVLLLCMAFLLGMSALALAEGEETASDYLISDEDVFSADEPVSEESADIALMQLNIMTEFSDTALTVIVTNEIGTPVPGVTLTFDVGNTIGVQSDVTNESGSIFLPITGLEPGTAIVCHAHELSTEDAVYLPADTSVIIPGEVPTTTSATDDDPTSDPDTTTTAADTSTTTTPLTAATTTPTTMAPLPTLAPTQPGGTTRSMPTYQDVSGTTTTHVQNDTVYTNLMIDEHLLKDFGYSIQTFDQIGRLALNKNLYTQLTDTYGSAVFGKLTSSVLSEVTADRIRDAKKGVEAFDDCDPEHAKILTFAASLQFMSENGYGLTLTDTDSLGNDQNVVFEFSIPVPKSMEHCKSFGIAVTGENVMSQLFPVAVKDGVVTFPTKALGHFTLVGFTDGSEEPGGSPLGTLKWVLIALGVLMFALMGFFIYYFFFRDRGGDPDDDPDGDPGDGDDRDTSRDNADGDDADGGDPADKAAR